MVETAKSFVRFLTDIVHDRSVLWGLAKNDVRAKFAASFLGSVWAFIQPLITLLVLWFVFQVGFRNPPVSDVPFMVWYAPAYLVWSFFSEALTSGTNCLIEYSYLVKKVNFRVSIIPWSRSCPLRSSTSFLSYLSSSCCLFIRSPFLSTICR